MFLSRQCIGSTFRNGEYAYGGDSDMLGREQELCCVVGR